MRMLVGPLVILMTVMTIGCHRPTVDELTVYGELGEFSLTDQSGKPITQADLQGKVWVAGFIFTNCTGPCPHVTATMARLQKEMADLPNFRLVTFTVDPERDNVAQLAQYAKQFSADPARWMFLTGPEDEIQRVLRERFKVHRIATKNPMPGQEFDHSTKLILVDAQGQIRGLFDGWAGSYSSEMPDAFEANLDKLRESIRSLAQ